jgi:high-affinity nickel permease
MTAVSVIVAVLVGGLEVINLIGDQFGLTEGGGFWSAIATINDCLARVKFLSMRVTEYSNRRAVSRSYLISANSRPVRALAASK